MDQCGAGEAMTTDPSFTYEGCPIKMNPTFAEDDGPLANRVYLISEEGAKEIERAQHVLKRGLTMTETLSVLIHRSARIILGEE